MPSSRQRRLNNAASRFLAGAGWAILCLVTAPLAVADEARVAHAVGHNHPERFCLGARVAANGATAGTARTAPPTGPAGKMSGVSIRSNDRLDRLLREKRVELMKTGATRLFLGVNGNGRLGLHLDGSELLQRSNGR